MARPAEARATRTRNRAWQDSRRNEQDARAGIFASPLRLDDMSTAPNRVAPAALPFREFVALIAALMALNALAIDAMLPALPAIGTALGVEGNARQWVVTAYLLGLGVGQIVYGTLADRFGRRPVLLWALGGYVVFSGVAAISASFPLLLAARVLQGLASAGARVVAVSIVRDCYSGRAMARVMSLAFIVFLAVPMFAPALGQFILLFASWRWIFGILGIAGLAVTIWTLTRLPETMHAEDRRPITVKDTAEAFRLVLTDRCSIGYTLAQTVLAGGLFGFIGSVQQIFFDIFHEPKLFPTMFAAIAGTMAIASYTNSRIVERFGTRRVSHSALLGFLVFAVVHLAFALAGHETIWSFAILQALMMGCFGLTMGNFGAMAMDPLGHVAGTASSVQGCVSTVGGALIGFLISQSFDGTTVPLTLGFAITGSIGLAIVLATERGRLFRPQMVPAH